MDASASPVGEPPTLSVVVISYNNGCLEACLDALARQSDATEIIVSDCSAVDPGARLAPRFPGVHFLHFDTVRSVPQLRWAAWRRSRGTILASLEARSVPAADWCAALVRGHRDHPAAPAVGGPISLREPATARDWGVYLCEYGRLAPPVTPGPTDELSGANVSYKRADLEAASDVIDAGKWEVWLHERWLADRRPLILTDAAVTFENVLSLPAILQQRFAYGRGFAAERFERRRWMRRALFTLGAVLLPMLLTVRLIRSVAPKGLLARCCRAALWILLFNAAWAAGEMAGYAFGDSGHAAMY